MSSDARIRGYAARQIAAGRTKKEIIRLLKRAIAREIHGSKWRPGWRCTALSRAAPAVVAGFGYRAGRGLRQGSGVVPHVAAWAVVFDRRTHAVFPWLSRAWPSGRSRSGSGAG
ncbi:hypothetical protein GCM10022227_06240 [Streptomyces sedi]